MTDWVKRLYISVLKDNYKISDLIISLYGNIFHVHAKLSSDISIQEWIDKLQDK